jgi:hypothetical protein
MGKLERSKVGKGEACIGAANIGDKGFSPHRVLVLFRLRHVTGATFICRGTDIVAGPRG